MMLSQLIPATPGTGVRLGLPDVIEVVVGPDAKHFQPSVGIQGGGDLFDVTAQRAPSAPGTGVRDRLPDVVERIVRADAEDLKPADRKSTRLNSSHLGISYAVFCL